METFFEYDGDLLKGVRIKRGAEKRPLWRRLETLKPDEMVFWIDRFDSLCAIPCEWALAQALEQAADVQIPLRTQYVRSVLCEVNRLIWLTTYLGRVMSALYQNTLAESILVLREQTFVMQEELTGGRILPQAFNVGGTRRDLALGDVQKIRQFLQGWKFLWTNWKSIFGGDPLIKERLQGLITLTPEFMTDMSWWGIAGKASGLMYDSRKHRPHGAYSMVDFEIVGNRSGDAWARLQVAIQEIELTLSLLEKLLKTIPTELAPRPAISEFKPGVYFGAAESAKGPVISVVEVTNRVSTVRLFSTGQRVWPHIDPLFKGVRVEDFEVALASLGIDGEDSEL